MEENPNTTSNWVGDRKIGVTIIEKILAKFPEVSPTWLLTGEGEMLKPDVASGVLDVNEYSNYKLIPLCSQDVVAGVNNEECDSVGYITGYIPFVNAKSGDIAVPVTNNSMEPTYSPGSIIRIRKIESWLEYLEFGQVYVIELKDERRLIKEIRRGNDKEHFTLISHNKSYDETEISINFIRSVWLVLAKYQKVVM